ncbi:hypothetical protein RCO48_05570 [Peribacillus frigoritolerans]|nr:hypothetical protein [Peribacillus frigoritolerans]
MNKEWDDGFIEALMVSLQDERVIEKIQAIAEAGSYSQLGEHQELLKEKRKRNSKTPTRDCLEKRGN